MAHFSPSRLRDLRENAGLRREELAVNVGRSYSSIVGYESGTVTPSIPMAETIAAVLDVDVRELFAADEDLAGATP